MNEQERAAAGISVTPLVHHSTYGELPLAFTEAELKAVELLAAAGLVPTLRHREAA